MRNTNFREIENVIDKHIEIAEQEYELDRWDVKEIRLKVYKENGWSFDPDPFDNWKDQFPTEEEDEFSVNYTDMEDRLFENGMSERDFF